MTSATSQRLAIEFQSTLPRGERRTDCRLATLELVSIHAPARGATARSTRSERLRGCVSIHAPARGATSRFRLRLSTLREFQSTLPRGERPIVHRALRIDYQCFNPRSRAGSDDDARRNVPRVSTVSIHAPARGATVSAIVLAHRDRMFQSTLPRGERPASRAACWPRYYVFQSTLPRGERLSWIGR